MNLKSFVKILDFAGEAIISIDRGRSILLFNRGAVKMFGHSARSMKGKTFDLLVPGASASGAPPRTCQRLQMLGVRKDRSEFQAEASISKTHLGGRPVFTIVMRDVTERNLSEQRLRTALRKKQVLIEEIHHRVKNNLQVISSILALQSRSIRDSAAQQKLVASQSRIQSMAILHEMLQESGGQPRIHLADYLRRLVQHLARSYGAAGRIPIRMELESLSVSTDSAVPCGLILNELISNSLEHAFPGAQGEVRVELNRKPGGIVHLGVSDNGIGLPAGVDWKSPPSLGLRLVKALAAQLEATVKVGPRRSSKAKSARPNSNPGTDISIDFGPSA